MTRSMLSRLRRTLLPIALALVLTDVSTKQPPASIASSSCC